MASLIPDDEIKSINTKPKDENITYARTCYDHMAGELGVKITESLVKKGILKPIDQEYLVTAFGTNWFNGLGISVDEMNQPRPEGTGYLWAIV